MAAQRCADGGQIVWDEDKSQYLCEVCGQRKCSDCSNTIEVDQDGIYCMRCDDEREMLSYGNI